MKRPAAGVASRLSIEDPPSYTEASRDVLLSTTAPSINGSQPIKCSVNTTTLPSVGLKAASSRTSMNSEGSATLFEHGSLSKESIRGSRVAKASRDIEDDVPPGAHRVQSPYKLKRKNSSIFRDFFLFDGDSIPTYLPDIRLRTKNALLHSEVYISAQEWERPVSVHARTKNSDLILGIHVLQSDQPVHVRASTKNGRSRIFLPRDFRGLLAVSTKNGKFTLSDDLKKVAVRIPSRYKEMVQGDEFSSCRQYPDRVKEEPTTDLSNGVDVWYEINGDGPSEAIVDTKNGNVWAGFVEDEVEDDKFGCWPICSVV